MTQADTAWWQTDGKTTPPPYRGVVVSSRYLTMRDGVKIAIDIYLPRNLRSGERLPTILRQTRYHRRMLYNWPFGWLLKRVDLNWKIIRRVVASGYAIINVDARGSGASFGSRRMEWSPDEVRDGAEVVDWIIQQPWSNGMVGSTGVSYNGTAAEMLLINQHPAVKAAILQHSLFDIYPDILCPGGARNDQFMQTWSRFNDALDRDQLRPLAQEIMPRLSGLAIKGVAPIDDDVDGAILQEALKDHADNYDIYENSTQVEFRDDVNDLGVTLDMFSPHAFMEQIEGSGAAIYSWSSYFDGAYTLSAVHRFRNVRTPGSRLVLGPWDHGGRQNPDPWVEDGKPRFDLGGEMLRFFDHHLKGVETGIADEPPVHYFTMGEEVWKACDTWPPPEFDATPFYLAEGRTLRPGAPPDGDGFDAYQMDYSAGTGRASRWVTLVNVAQVKIGYPDRREQDNKLLAYDTAPLERAVEVTGDPIVTLFVRPTTEDAQFFVYLEDVLPNGDVYYVTEGQFRAVHRGINRETPLYQVTVPYHSFKREDALPLVPGEVAAITFHLQPVSYLFQKGHAIRVAIAGADKDNFALLPAEPPKIELLRGQDHPSHLLLPVKMR